MPKSKTKDKIKQSQKQSQKQKQTVIVNVGTTQKSKRKYTPREPKKKSSVNQLSMFAPPITSIYTYPPQFKENETAPKVEIPTRARRDEYVPFAEQPIRRPREFFTETSTVEFLPDEEVNNNNNEEAIVNEYTDDPVQINAGIIDDYNPNTNETEYYNTQIPQVNMTMYNPVQDDPIDNVKYNEESRRIVKLKKKEFDNNNEISQDFISNSKDDSIDNFYNDMNPYEYEQINNPLKQEVNKKKLPIKKRNLNPESSVEKIYSINSKSLEDLQKLAKSYNINIYIDNTYRTDGKPKEKSRATLIDEINRKRK